MKRKTSDLETRIWTFGCLKPCEETRGYLWNIMRSAHRYYNKLVEIESARRIRSAQLGKMSDQDKVGFSEAQEEFKKRIAAWGATNGYQVGPNGTYGPVVIGRAKDEVVPAMLKEDWSQAWKDRLESDTEALRLMKEARGSCGVPSPTYVLVEKAFESAKSKPGVPKFKSWNGSGRIGVSVKKLPASEMGNNASSIVFRPRREDLLQGHAPRPDRQEVELKVGPGSKTIRLACIVHRSIPADATVTQAWIRVTREGIQEKYTIQLVLESASFVSEKPDPNLPSVAVDIGWRRKPNGSVRVAYWADSKGREGEVLVPEKIDSGLRFCDKLRSANHMIFNRTLLLTQAWLKGHKDELTEELREISSHAHSWKSPRRLAKFAAGMVENEGRDLVYEAWTAWRKWRLENNLDLMASYSTVKSWASRSGMKASPFVLYLEFWRRKNRHLYGWEESYRSKCLGARDEVFKIEAARMAKEYGMIVFENFDLRAFARDALPDEEKDPDKYHRLRNLASPGRFRKLVMSAVGKMKISDEDMKDSTRQCHACNFVNTGWKNPAKIEQTCECCGSVWDQDKNAAIVLLNRHNERVRNGLPPAPARKPSRPMKKREMEVRPVQ